LNVTKRAQNCQVLGGMTCREIDPGVKTKAEVLLGADISKLMFCSQIIVTLCFFSKVYERHTKQICHYVIVKKLKMRHALLSLTTSCITRKRMYVLLLYKEYLWM